MEGHTSTRHSRTDSSAYSPDEETKAAAEVLETLQKQQPAAGHHGSSNLSTPPGEAEYFKGGGLMRTVQESVKRQKMHSSPISAAYTSHTCRFNLNNNCRYPYPGKSASRGLNESYPQGRFTQLTQGGFEVHCHPQGQVHQLHTPVHLAPVVAQLAVVAKVLMN